MKKLCTVGMWLVVMCGTGGAGEELNPEPYVKVPAVNYVQHVALNYHDISQPRIIRVEVTAKSVIIVERIASNMVYAIPGGGGPPDKLIKTVYKVVNGEIDTANREIIEGYVQPPATTPEKEVWPEPRPAPKSKP